MKDVMSFGKKGKLSPQYVGLFEVLERVGKVAYRLALLPSLSGVHAMFHVSMLQKYYGDPSYILDFITVQLNGDLTYDMESVAILDRQCMAPKKKARAGQRANVTPGVTVDPIIDDAGDHPRSENIPQVTTLPDSTTADQTALVPTPIEGATVPPTDIPVPPPASDLGVSDIELRGAIQMLTKIVASQAQRSSVGPTSSCHPGEPASSRVNKFLQSDPLVFTGTDPEEDPLDFIDEMHKTLRVMHTTETEGVEWASYRLKGVAYSWFELWEESREEGSPPARWGEFTDAFMDHFFPSETKAARASEFESLKQGSMNVWDYHMEFARLSKYAIHMLPTMEARVRQFVQGLSPLVINEASTAALNFNMNYGKMVAFAQVKETRKLKNRIERQSSSKARSVGKFGCSSGGSIGRSAFRGWPSGPSQ
ncbi:uncharacterized protein [Nicotiana tomentosiformis]|uniref:uncharacterized protein n=1 Tax=Nicotiana tomentosiformis TaxID=4098 RepID=UPI00388C4D85